MSSKNSAMFFCLSLILLTSCNLGDTKASTANKIIFVSNSTPNGAFGGVASADAICDADIDKPNDSSTYKALIVQSGVRRACTTADCAGGASENLNWVLKANTTYEREGGFEIGTTNASGIFVDGFSGTISDASHAVYTGLTTTWTVGTTCNDWTYAGSDISTGNAGGGFADATDPANAFAEVPDNSCIQNLHIYCVEQ